MENQHFEEELTPEQLAEKKADMLNFYTDSIPYLDAQLLYEQKLLAIDEARFKRMSLQMQYAMMMNEAKNAENEEEKEQTVSDDNKSDGVGQENTNLSSSTHKQSVSSSSQKSLMHALDAPSRYKFWLLERFGWQVIHVPWSEWPRKESLLEKSRYIANRLSESSELKQALR